MTGASRPLAGLRLVSLALHVPGPVALARLVQEGATACKIEPPSGDPLAAWCPSWYAALHQDVRVVRVDLKTVDGRGELEAQLDTADVLVTSQRPSALARLSLSPGDLAARHPALRIVSIVGDETEPEVAGHDLTYQAAAGLVDDRLPRTLLADLAGAERVCTAVLLALRQPPGWVRTVGLYDSLDMFTAPLRHGLTTTGAALGGGLPAYGVYATRDGHVAVAALEPHFRARLYEALGLALDAPIADALRTRPAREWEAWGRAHDVPIVEVR
ncbi:MAG: CoA transferase [Vicinamibacterales bacterium]|nr:CoA transferase [Vicinamibacterales bacterium]